MSSDAAVVRWIAADHHHQQQKHIPALNDGGVSDGGCHQRPQRRKPSCTTATTTCHHQQQPTGSCPTVALDRRRQRLRADVASERPSLTKDSSSSSWSSSSSSSSSSSTSSSLLWLCLVLSVVLVSRVETTGAASVGGESSSASSSGSSTGSSGHYTHTWAVHVPGGEQVANRIAAEHGFLNMGKIIDDHYHFHHTHVQRRSVHAADEHHGRLVRDARVHWARQQRAKSRPKRDFVRQRPSRTSTLAAEARMPLNDPKWSQMWYLNRGNGLDMNVIPAWHEGITGRGVVVTILDDGLESDHPDLQQNYDPRASYDVNSHDDDPMPHYDMTDSNRHGTRCAGEVAATANNSFCAVGIAYGANVGGVRMLDGDVTDAVEARSLSLNPQHIDIYSASWGPDDDGKTVDGPGELATRAFIEGVTKGRAGKGSIFVWASGNGGREHDNCNCDGYTNSIWTLSISSATEEGHVPWYSEKCSSTLATTYSSGGSSEKQIVTTDLHHTCTASHTGTSASAPLAAGIVALVLEANGNLTWRDLQHIVVRTAKPSNLKDPTWTKNGIGRRVSHSFGYGLMDASAMVQLARKWKTVPEQQRCEINAPHLDTSIPPKTKKTLLLEVQHCKGVNFLEHVQAKITLTTQRRGDIEIYLQSPAGTRVTLLTSRTHDVSRSGFNQWPFMSVHTWGEAPHGSWKLEIGNEGRFMGHAALKGWSLIFYGTTQPIHKNDPVSIRLEPNSSLSASKYPIIVMPKAPSLSSLNAALNLGIIAPNSGKAANGGGGGRKQQQQQQQQQLQQIMQQQQQQSTNQKQATSQSSPQSAQRKPPKQSKNNGKNNGKNGSGGQQQQQQQRTTTMRPFSLSTNIRYTPAERTRTYNLSDYLASLNAASAGSTARPLAANHLDTSATAAEISSSNKPLVSVKAPKQVKQNYAAPATTSRPNIPKKFQNYEKVQEIYPEFQAYDGPVRGAAGAAGSAATTRAPYFGGGLLASSGSYSLNGGGKPSRENAKKQFFTDSRDGGQQTPVGKKNSSQIVLVRSPDVRSHSNVTANLRWANRTAQITEWEMIFHGTEAPAQSNDPPPSKVRGSPENGGSNSASASYSSSEIEHNSLEFEPSDSDQWRDENQMDGSHSDVQRTASNDQTASACRSFLPNKLCIECSSSTVLHEGHCFTDCPENFYLLTSDLPQPNESPPMMRRRRRRRQLPLTDRQTAPKPEREELDMSTAARRQPKICASCHPSCRQCRAASETDCTSCLANSTLLERSAGESLCVPHPPSSSNTTHPLIPSSSQILRHPIALIVAKVVLVVAILASVCELLRKYTRLCCCLPAGAGGGVGAGGGGSAAVAPKTFGAYAYGKVSTGSDEAGDDEDEGGDEDQRLAVSAVDESKGNGDDEEEEEEEEEEADDDQKVLSEKKMSRTETTLN